MVLSLSAQIEGKVEREVKGENGKPTLVVFGKTATQKAGDVKLFPKLSESKQLFKSVLDLKDGEEFEVIYSKNDAYGNTHVKHQQFYNEIKVEHGEYFIHAKGENVHSMNGTALDVYGVSVSKSISEDAAIKKAVKYINAEEYHWDNDKSKYPKPELVIVEATEGKAKGKFVVAYKLGISTFRPLTSANYFVDANSGEIIRVENTLYDAAAQGTADTRYSGQRTILTDSNNGSYRLRDYSLLSAGILTQNMNNQESTYNLTDFTDSDNNWTSAEYHNSSKDDAALDAHWGIVQTIKYWQEKHNRNSYDGNGSQVKVYVHMGNNVDNAYWNPNDKVMMFGDGSQFDALVSIDIIGHEFGHGICQHTCNLTYSYESGALNEAFSDIWGACVEYYAAPSKDTWLCGEDIGDPLRDMSNPNAKQQPDTYKGDQWYSGSGDNGGVHYNSGVLNFGSIYYVKVVMEQTTMEINIV